MEARSSCTRMSRPQVMPAHPSQPSGGQPRRPPKTIGPVAPSISGMATMIVASTGDSP